MSEKPLLLPESKSPVLVYLWQEPYPRLRLALVVVGVFMVLVGAADALSRLAKTTLGDDAATQIFAPAVVSGAAASSTAQVPFTPARVKIPGVGVNADVELVGVKDDGSMGTPKDFANVGWYTPGARPGEAGNAVFAGHVNNALTKAGVFAHLKEVRVGEYITVEDASGKALVYQVVAIEQYDAETAPAAAIFTKQGPSQLVLITCDGQWDPGARTFEKRLVVFAKLQ